MNFLSRFFHRPFFIRLFNWEYWSFSTVYLPIYPIWFFLALRARSFFFFAASNPSIKNGGFLAESKKDIYAIMPDDLYPASIFFDLPVSEEQVLEQLRTRGFSFPLIGKPNMGGRGRGVKRLNNEEDVRHYVRSTVLDFHIQQYIAYPNEVGIFYHRYPGADKGEISGIVQKEFLSVTGDGKHTLRELLQRDSRGIMYLAALERIHGEAMLEVLPDGEKKIVSHYGNHARGSKFLDHTHLADPELVTSIDGICRKIKDFHYGRLDIRYKGWESLRQGKDFSVIEVNGAGSEPTHMYDPRHSLFFAWKEIVRHWVILWKISRVNHKKGYPYLTLRQGMTMFREDKENSRKLEQMPE
jgi:hypothetical protein